MEILGLAGILIALALLFYMALKGFSLLIVGPLAAIVIVVFNGMGFAGITSTYLGGVGGMVTNVFGYALLGAILGKYYEDSHAASTVANSIMKLVGADKENSSPMRVVIAVTVVAAVLTYAGVSVFAAIFALVPIAREMFRKANLPWHIALIPVVLGMCTFTNTTMPGAIILSNILPTNYLGTTLTAMPVASLVASAACIVWSLLYCKFQLKKALAKGEAYVESGGIPASAADTRLPTVAESFAPIIVLLAVVFGGSVLKVANIAYIAMLVSVLVAMIALRKYIPSHKKTLAGAGTNSIGTVMSIAAVVGVGSCITTAPGFSIVSNALSSISGNPIFSLILMCLIMGVVTASPSGSLGIILANFAQGYVAAGLAPEVVHRVVAIATCGFAAMPHSGGCVALLACAGLTHKEGFKHCFMVTFVGQTISLAVIVIFSSLGWVI